MDQEAIGAVQRKPISKPLGRPCRGGVAGEHDAGMIMEEPRSVAEYEGVPVETSGARRDETDLGATGPDHEPQQAQQVSEEGERDSEHVG